MLGRSRVLEGEDAVVPHAIDERQRALEVFDGLAGKAHDDVGRERDIGHCRPDAIDDLQVGVAGVAPAHGREHARRARLHRQMEVLADVGQIAKRGDRAGRSRAAGAGWRTGCAPRPAPREPPPAAPQSRSPDRPAPGSGSRSGRATGSRAGPSLRPPAPPPESRPSGACARARAYTGRRRSCRTRCIPR